jgi:uncharacterized protein YdeI (YjbR/CyaY-like superfamily)
MDDELQFFASAEEFERWLEEHGDAADGIWVKMAKKHTGFESLDWTAGVEVALCFGWIDGLSRGLDERHRLQRFTPRRKRSNWSPRSRARSTASKRSGSSTRSPRPTRPPSPPRRASGAGAGSDRSSGLSS